MFSRIQRKFAISSNISTYLSRSLIIITLITTLVVGGILIFQQTIYFNKLSKQVSNEYIQNERLYVQEIVNNEIEYIGIQNEYFKKEIAEKIKHNVNQAYFTAESIYQKYAGKKTEEELKSLIIATVASLKFDMEYEEVFVSTLDGKGVYYPRKPEFTGKDMTRFRDANDLPVVQKEIDLLRSTNEGFLDYELNKSNISEFSPHKKISFIKKFGHFNWYFGSKQYINDYFVKFLDEIAKKISTVRFKHGGYVFMNNTNGRPIIMDGVIYTGKLNMLTDKQDPRHPIFLQQLKNIKEYPEGGFFTYKWNKMNGSTPIEKCSFIKLFKEYNWIVGAGFYLDEIEQSIAEKQQALYKDQQKNILIILVILFALLLIEGGIIYRFNFRYKSDFERFFKFFFSLQTNLNQLKPSEFYFDEYKQAALAANQMVQSRREIEEKLIEEQKKAMESDRLKSAFLANMSHEIRTPMNAIIGFSELLEDKDQDQHDKDLFVKLIRRNGEILLNLINDIIDISKIEANLMTIRKKPVHIAKFVKEIEYHYIDTISTKKEKALTFQLSCHVDSTVVISTDEIRLRQVFDNLIGNAIKFTPSGTIMVLARKENDKIFFSVSDTGIGIPADQQDTIFERFIQAEQDHKTNFGGTGLGLAISKHLIELLGGKIQVNSEPGKGATFTFYLPIN